MNAVGGLAGLEVGAGFAHVGSADAFDLEGAVAWMLRLGSSPAYPFISAGGGLRHDSVGSFGMTRYPVGFGIGLRALLGARAGVRLEYNFRRVLNDPVANFSEHEVMLGISLFFRNCAPIPTGGETR